MSLVPRRRWIPRILPRAARPDETFPVRHAVLLAGFAVGAHLVRSGWIIVPPCGWRARVGFPCPGCGGTRATLAFFAGDLPRAFLFHPLVAGLLLAWVWAQLHWGVRRITGQGWVVRMDPLPRGVAFGLGMAGSVAVWLTVVVLSRWWPESGAPP